MSPTLRAALGPLVVTMVASVVGSLVIVWAVSRLLDFRYNPGLVAVLAAVLSAAVAGPRLLRPRQP